MANLVTAAQLKTFTDWTRIDSQHVLIGRFGRGSSAPTQEFRSDYEGLLQRYDPQWGPVGTVSAGLKLIPGGFHGILTAKDSSQVSVWLAAGDPVSMAAEGVGGALDRVSVQSKMVMAWIGFGTPDLWIYFLEGQYLYSLQIVKDPWTTQ